MTSVFADTAYFLALMNPRDTRHQQAKSLAQKPSGYIFTTEFILVELANFGRTEDFRQRFVRLVEKLRRKDNVQIIPANPGLFDQGLSLYAARLDKEWSLTDCTSFVTMNALSLTDAYTSDHHFEQAGFRILMK